MSQPDLTSAEVAAVVAVLESGALSLGRKVIDFERQFAAFVGGTSAVAVANGTTGLHLCMRAAGLGRGDLVITTPFSFVASANCILYEQAVPIFVDVDPLTGNIDPGLLDEAVRDLVSGTARQRRWLPPSLRRRGVVRPERLKGVLPVHVFGTPAEMTAILDVARRHELFVVEDACEAIGAEYGGRQAGTFGDAAVFAFYPNKQMTTAEGGMIVVNNSAWEHRLRCTRNQGRRDADNWLRHEELGYNYRLDELRSALGIVQLSRIHELLAKRARVAEWYTTRLNAIDGVATPCCLDGSHRSWFVYVIRLANEAMRDHVAAALQANGIPSRVYFPPIHLQPLYRNRFGYSAGDFPVAEAMGRCNLALPFSSVMTEQQVDHVCKSAMGALAGASRPVTHGKKTCVESSPIAG